MIVSRPGYSFTKNHTQIGPNTVSNSINRLTLSARVYRVAVVRAKNDRGKISAPLIDMLVRLIMHLIHLLVIMALMHLHEIKQKLIPMKLPQVNHIILQ